MDDKDTSGPVDATAFDKIGSDETVRDEELRARELGLGTARSDEVLADRRLAENARFEEMARSAGSNTGDLVHTAAVPAPTQDPTTDNATDDVAEAAGGVSGVVAGAALGSVGGPIGTVIGGIAGAIGGWWAGRALSHAARHFTDNDDEYYREHYQQSGTRLADRSYEQVRPAYQLGHVAGLNPSYAGQSFDVVEPDLRRGWDGDISAHHGEWGQVRGYARDAFQRASNSAEALRAREEAHDDAGNSDTRLDDTAGVRYF